MTEALVQLRARVRFMIYGQKPADFQEVDAWVLRVPPAWVQGVAPGASSPELTQRCGQAVAAQYEAQRAQAIAHAQAAVAAGGDYDAGHYALEGASVWMLQPEELRRRPWTAGRHRFFRVVGEDGRLREGTEADAPRLPPLTAVEERAFAGWRAEESEDWRTAAEAYGEALRLAGPDSAADLVGEAGAGLVRANGKMGRIEPAVAAASAVLALSLPDRWKTAINARLGEAYLTAKHPREAADAFAAAAAALPAGHPQHAYFQSQRGLAFLRSSDYRAAGEALQAALRAQPADTDPQTRASTLFNCALALEHEGRLEEAQAHLRSALVVRRQQGAAGTADAADTELALARVLARSGPSHAAESQTLLGRYASLVPPGTTVQGLHIWATALVELGRDGDKARAVAGIDRAAAMIKDPSYARWIAEDRARLVT